jgi:ADP-heptose:LPS heptosyltransferase
MNRLTNYCGKWIHHCGWYPDKKLRLFDSGKGQWQGVNPHDEYVLQKGSSSSHLKGDILHYSYNSIKDHITQVNYFTDILSKASLQNGKKSNLLKILFSPLFKFFRDYIFKLGFLDGYYGFVICMISSHATFLKYVKMKQFQNKEWIDQFVNWDELEKAGIQEASRIFAKEDYDVCIHIFPNREVAKAVKLSGIKMRIGTTGRIFHWRYCNKLVKFTRKRSDLHEAQLNLKLLKPLSLPTESNFEELISLTGFTKLPAISEKVKSLIDNEKINLILHPKSKGSAIEWGLENFNSLINILPKDRYHIFISGTDQDEKSIGDAISFDQENVTSLLGKLSLDEFISFISLSDGLVAASTGPLHIAAAMNKLSIGLYSPRRPIHPGRWRPIGSKAIAVVNDENCEKCGRGESCDCMLKIEPQRIVDLINHSFEG